MADPQWTKMSGKQAVENIIQGILIENADVESLELIDQTIEKEVHISNSRIGQVKIQNCTFKALVLFDNVVFTGKTDFNVEPGQCTYQESLTYNSCTFEDELSATDAHFLQKVTCEQAQFAKRVSFARARFQEVSFAKSQFLSTSRFEDAIFENSASFMEAAFSGKANFKKSQFRHNAYFRKTNFQEGASFENASFQLARFEDMTSAKKMIFKVAHFHGKGYFHRGQYQSEVVFRGIQAREQLYLSHMVCHDKVDFSGMEAFNTITLEESKFLGVVDFSKCIFHHDVYMHGTIFEKEVNFEKGMFNMRLDCSMVNFGEKINLSSANPSAFIIERSQIAGKISAELQENYEESRKIYAMLRRNFEVQGNHEDADWAYYHFRRSERKAKKIKSPLNAIQKFCNWAFFDLSSGYGTKPFNVVIVALLVVSFFSTIYWAFGSQFYVAPAIRSTSCQGVTFFQAFYLSAMTFTTLGTEGISPLFDGWLKYFLVVEGFLGLFLMTVFVGVYTRKMAK